MNLSNKDGPIYNKFNVVRTDGTSEEGGKHYGCQYFVLDLTHDPFAKLALKTYAKECKSKFPILAQDIQNRYFNE